MLHNRFSGKDDVKKLNSLFCQVFVLLYSTSFTSNHPGAKSLPIPAATTFAFASERFLCYGFSSLVIYCTLGNKFWRCSVSWQMIWHQQNKILSYRSWNIFQMIFWCLQATNQYMYIVVYRVYINNLIQ